MKYLDMGSLSFAVEPAKLDMYCKKCGSKRIVWNGSPAFWAELLIRFDKLFAAFWAVSHKTITINRIKNTCFLNLLEITFYTPDLDNTTGKCASVTEVINAIRSTASEAKRILRRKNGII